MSLHRSRKGAVTDEESIYDLIANVTDRLERQEAVDFEALLAEHPQHAHRLRQVLPTLQALAEIGDSVATGAGNCAAGEAAAEAVPRELGDFRILREIGRGGMGVVYEAEQISLDRRVALKVLPFAGMLDDRHLQRFKNESRAAASLSHPNIVPVHAVGCERGVHYYAMQYIAGVTLAEVIRGMTNDESQMFKEIRNPISQIRNAPTLTFTRAASATHPQRPILFESVPVWGSPKERLRTIAEWGIQIAEALEYAHSVGLVHRDIKPANLLLDALGRVWVTDFGLAQFETDAGLTMTGDVIGTLRYMSPEQALGERGLVDQRSDVYSLGITLYELLTLTPPFAGANRRELLGCIAHDDPPLVRRLVRSIPQDLETIVHKAIEKDPGARYATARELAEDLRRHLHERPINARPATRIDHLRKWSRRNRTLTRVSGLSAAVVAISLAAALVLIDRERQQTRFAEQARAADQVIATAARKDLLVHRYVTSVSLAERAWNRGEFAEARRRLVECVPRPAEDDLRSFEWRYLSHATRAVPPAFDEHRGDVYCFRLSPDGRLAATGGQDGARIWDFNTGNQVCHLADHGGDVNGVAFSPDGGLLATAGDDQTARIWSTGDWQLLHAIRHIGNVVAVAFTPDGRILATAERWYDDPPGTHIGQNVVRVWDVATWNSLGELKQHTSALHSLAISENGTLLATGSVDGTACLWDLATRTLQHQLPHIGSTGSKCVVACVAFAHRKPLLATVGGNSIKLWRTGDGTLESTLKHAVKRPDCVAISPDDSAILAAGTKGRVQIFEAAVDGDYRPNSLFRATSSVWSATFVDQHTLVTTCHGGAVRRWDSSRNPDQYRISLKGPRSPNFAFSPDGKFLIAAAVELHAYDLVNQSHIGQFQSPEPCAMSVAYAPDGETIVTGHESGEVLIWDAESWQVSGKYPPSLGHVDGLQFVDGGRILAVHADATGTRYVDLRTRQAVPCPIPASYPIDWIGFDPFGGGGAATTRGSEVDLWKAGRRLRSVRLTSFGSSAIAGDCLYFAHASLDGTIRIWQSDVERPELVFVADSEPIHLMAFSVDGRTLAGIVGGGTLKVWNVATGRQMLSLETGLVEFHQLSFSPDGSALGASGVNIGDQIQIVIWRAPFAE